MNFLVIAHRFHTNLYYRVKALQDAGNKVKILVLYKGKSEYYESIDIQFLKLSFFSRLISKIIKVFKKNHLKISLELRIQSPNRKLKKELKTFKPDVIILKAYQNMLALKTLLVAKRFNIKVLMLTQTTFTHIKGSKFLFRLNIKLFKFLRVHSYITPIKSNYDAFKNFGIENVFYLPFVFSAATSFPNTQSKNKYQKNTIFDLTPAIKIISVGKFVKRKDQLLLIKAVHELMKQKYNIKLNLYGEKADEKYFNEINTYIQKHNLKQNINIFTNVPYKFLINEYPKHDIFVLPAYAEPAAYSIVEAMAYGLPVICSSENGTKCYIIEGKNGYIFEAKNRKSLTDKLELLISDNVKTKEMAKNSLLCVKENHSPENFTKKIIEQIKKLDNVIAKKT